MLTPDERPHSQGRRVEKLGIATPLLVPSFSSCGFSSVSEIYSAMKDRLYGVCLVSALDLSSAYIPADVVDEVNVTVIDSGMYESTKRAAGCTKHGAPCHAARWSRESYRGIADGVDRDANVILVNYDGPEPIERQIGRALEDFVHAPHAAHDFLVKPETPARLVNVARLAQHANELGQFDIVGITAREAGESLIQRCRTVVTMRDALYDAGLDLPVHVFGAITPLEVMTYYFCGADVFDGLNWLRLSFRGEAPMTIEATAFTETTANLCDWDLKVSAWTANLGVLYRLQSSLQHYGSSGDLHELARNFPSATRAVRIAGLAGAVVS